jgi:hypothetical protein
MHANMTARQLGLQPELIPPPLFAKSQYGEPPTASIPKTRDQPEEVNSIPAALWKQRLDRQIARCTDSSGSEGFDQRRAAHTALSRSEDRQRPYKNPIGLGMGRPQPAANPR